jgi:hypothetical protein
LEEDDRGEIGKILGGWVAFGTDALLRRPVQWQLAAELETRKMKPGVSGRLNAPLDLGQIRTPGAVGRVLDLKNAR